MKIKDIEIFTDDAMKIINQQEFIGIRLSGGIDSAVLCYLTLKYLPHIKLLPIIMYNKLRPTAENSVNNVLTALRNLNPDSFLMDPEVGIFDTTGFVKIIDDSGIKKHPKDIFQRPFIRGLFDKYNDKLNFVLSGETLNPPLSDQILLGMDHEFLKSRNIKSNDILFQYLYNEKIKYEYSPFRNYDKKQIAEVCKELNLMETLFPYTETCETEPHKYTGYVKEKFGLTFTNPGVEPCQCCWPCREKYWAYGVFDFNTPCRVKI